MEYIKIWKKHFGEIPKDEFGMSYEIHHIDGNKKNNLIENLKCISIKEHFDIHYQQGDYFSAHLISTRMKINQKQKDELKKQMSLVSKGKPKRKIDCKFCFSGISVNAINKHQIACKLNPDRKHTFIPKISESLKGKPKKGRKGGTKPKTIEHIKKIKETLTGTKQTKIQCPYCGKSGGNMMKVWHFENCLLKPGNENKKRVFSEKHLLNLRKPKRNKK
jgi:hypothetical protein